MSRNDTGEKPVPSIDALTCINLNSSGGHGTRNEVVSFLRPILALIDPIRLARPVARRTKCREMKRLGPSDRYARMSAQKPKDHRCYRAPLSARFLLRQQHPRCCFQRSRTCSRDKRAWIAVRARNRFCTIRWRQWPNES